MGRKVEIPYQYVCTKGHTVGGPQPVTTCPAVVRGKPCTGFLKRVGPGSRGSEKRDRG